MQLTRFDRWLREKFVHEIHVYSMRPAEQVPANVQSEELPDAPGRRFKHHYVARSSKSADFLISAFRENNQMYTTRIVDRKGWHIPLVAPKGKSVTWWLVSVVVASIGLFGVIHTVRRIWASPDFQKNFYESLEILQG